MRFMDWKDCFINAMNLDKKDRELIGLCYRDTVTADEVANYFDGIVFEESQYDLCCLIAQMCARHKYAGVPKHLVPKIRGLTRYLTTINALRVVELFKFLKRLNQADIPVMLTKGVAIRVGYYPQIIRYMADTDIYVEEKNFFGAVGLAKDYGCEGRLAYHSIDLKKGSLAVDIHRVFVKELLNGADSAGIWQRATKTDQNGVSFYIPSREDMVVQIVVSGFYNVIESAWDQGRKHIKWIIDLLPFLLDAKQADWERIILISEQLKISEQIKPMLLALNDILPQSLDTGKILGYFRRKEISPKAIALFSKSYAMHRVQCEKLASTSTVETILYWAQKTWISSRYLSGYDNPVRALLKFPQFCAVTMEIDSVKEIPGEIIRRIMKRAQRVHPELPG
jgi:hypothetical protein